MSLELFVETAVIVGCTRCANEDTLVISITEDIPGAVAAAREVFTEEGWTSSETDQWCPQCSAAPEARKWSDPTGTEPDMEGEL